MNKIASIACLAGGLVLVIIGISATNSFNSDVSRFFTGAPTDKAVWTLIAGSVLAVVGFAMTMSGRKGA